MEHKQPKRNISFSPPDISELEIEEVSEALRSGWITTGPRTKLLERRLAAYIDTGDSTVDCSSEEACERYANRVACLGSATAAEELILRILGVGPGDEVIVPAYTYTSTAAAVLHTGADVVFVDSQKDSVEMDYDALERAITERTKAVIPVDLGGVPCDYDRIFKAVEAKKSVFNPSEKNATALEQLGSTIQKTLGRAAVIADGAHALGASWSGAVTDYEKKMVGAIADFTSFSFHAVKNFTTAEGGAATWKPIDGIDDAQIYYWFQLLSLHGQSKDALAKTQLGAWEYDIVAPLYKCNMTDIAAAIGLRQLDRYPELLRRRQEIIETYDTMCDALGIEHLNHTDSRYDSSGHLYITRIPGITDAERRQIIIKMAERGVACNVHYKPLPMMTAYRQYGWDIKDFPHAYHLFENEITLPLHTKLTDSDIAYIVQNFSECIKEIRG